MLCQSQRVNEYGSYASMDWEHHLIHRGEMFMVNNFSIVSKNVPKNYLVVTPENDRVVHWCYFCSATNECSVKFYEDVTYSDSGSPLRILNRNRRADTKIVTKVLIYLGAIIVDTGLLLQSAFVGREGYNRITSIKSRASTEFILKPSCNYLIQVIPLRAECIIVFNSDFYTCNKEILDYD